MYLTIYVYVYTAAVLDATPTHYSVELLAKMRKIMIEKDKIILVGDKNGSVDPAKRCVYVCIYIFMYAYIYTCLD
jgi:hypothetical protein